MKRVRRWLFNFAAAVALVLFLATGGLWARSRVYGTSINFYFFRQLVEISVARGEVAIELTRFVPDQPGFWFSRPYMYQQVLSKFAILNDSALSATDHLALGFGFGHSQARQAYERYLKDWQHLPTRARGLVGFRVHRIVFPLWFAMFSMALLPLYWLYRRRQHRKRLLHGLCLVCGYDLRATPDRCPECGAIAASAKGAAT